MTRIKGRSAIHAHPAILGFAAAAGSDSSEVRPAIVVEIFLRRRSELGAEPFPTGPAILLLESTKDLFGRNTLAAVQLSQPDIDVAAKRLRPYLLLLIGKDQRLKIVARAVEESLRNPGLHIILKRLRK